MRTLQAMFLVLQISTGRVLRAWREVSRLSSKGKPLFVNAYRDGQGRKSLAESIDEREGTGSNLHLTLDLNIQETAEAALAKTVTQFEAKSGVAVAIEVGTGNILAMASYPTFDPGQASKSAPATRRNRSVTDSFEPGSTMKPLLWLLLYRQTRLMNSSRYMARRGRYRVGGHTIRDTSPKEWMDLTTVIAKSSNIGIAKLVSNSAVKNSTTLTVSWVLGSRTKVGLSGEISGILREPKGLG